jgi:formyl-CoA transferase
VLLIVGGGELAADPRFADFGARSTAGRMEEIDQVVAGWIARHLAEEVIRRFEAQDVAAGLVCDAQTILDESYFRERGAVVTVEDAELGSMRMPGAMPKLRHNPGAVRWAGPTLGQHNDEILRGLLGLSEEETARLVQLGVVAPSRGPTPEVDE